MLPKVHKIFWTATVNTKWQFVLPADARKQFDIKSWDQLLVIWIDNLLVWLIKIDDLDQAIEHLQSIKKMWEKIPSMLRPKELKNSINDIWNHIEELQDIQQHNEEWKSFIS